MSTGISCPVPVGKSKSCEEAVRLKRLEYTLQFCSLTILYFDYVLTLPDEIKYIWLRRWRISTMLYFFCRYALVANLLYLLSISEDLTGVNCNIGYMICGILSILGHIGILTVWSLRTCAVFNNNRYLLAFFGVLTASVVGMLIYRTPFIRCSGQKDMSQLLGANGAIVLFIEIFTFLLATYKVWKTSRDVKKNTEGGMVNALNDVILSQGIVYIGGVSLLSTGVLILNFKAKTGFISRLLNGLKLPLSGFLTARFMLRLRAWTGAKQRPTGQSTSTPQPGVSTLGATSIVPMAFKSGADQTATFLEEFKGEIGHRTRGGVGGYSTDDYFEDYSSGSGSSAGGSRGDVERTRLKDGFRLGDIAILDLNRSTTTTGTLNPTTTMTTMGFSDVGLGVKGGDQKADVGNQVELVSRNSNDLGRVKRA